MRNLLGNKMYDENDMFVLRLAKSVVLRCCEFSFNCQRLTISSHFIGFELY
jgi:hypothetical protein